MSNSSVVIAVPCSNDERKAFSSLPANIFWLSVFGFGIDTRIAFLLILAGLDGERSPSLLRTCSCIWSLLSFR